MTQSKSSILLPSVLLSTDPYYCHKILIREKLIEVRKTRPKIDTPFKSYIYCTKGRFALLRNDEDKRERYKFEHWNCANFHEKCGKTILNCKVIGEFVCDKIDKIHIPTELMYEKEVVGFSERTLKILNQSCLSYDEIVNYSGCTLNNYDPLKEYLYGWHISDLVIYDNPKELREFVYLCPEYKKEKFTSKCRRCKHYFRNDYDMCFECDCEGEKRLTRPPQSWCYIEEVCK